MRLTDMVSLYGVIDVSGSEIPEEDLDKFAQLGHDFEDFCEGLADGFFRNVTENISLALDFGSKNPLCVVLVCCVLTVISFHLIRAIFNVFRGRG